MVQHQQQQHYCNPRPPQQNRKLRQDKKDKLLLFLFFLSLSSSMIRQGPIVVESSTKTSTRSNGSGTSTLSTPSTARPTSRFEQQQQQQLFKQASAVSLLLRSATVMRPDHVDKEHIDNIDPKPDRSQSYRHVHPTTTTTTSPTNVKDDASNCKLQQKYEDIDRDDDDDIDSLLRPPTIHLQDMVSLLHFTSILNEQLQTNNNQYHQYHGSPTLSPSQPLSTLEHHCSSTVGGVQDSSVTSSSIMDRFVRGGETTDSSSYSSFDDRGQLYTSSPVQRTRRKQPYRIPYTKQQTTVPTTTTSMMMDVFRSDYHNHNKQNQHEQLQHDDLYRFMSNVFQVLDDNDEPQNDDFESVTTTLPTHSSSSSLERTLMMIYLDRACRRHRRQSTTQQHYQPISTIPFCTPSTVRYLSLTAYLIALGAVRGNLLLCYNRSNQNNNHYHNSYMQSLYYKLERTMGIPVIETQYRVSVMLQSLLNQQQPLSDSTGSLTTIHSHHPKIDNKIMLDKVDFHDYGQLYYHGDEEDYENEAYEEYLNDDDDDTGIYVTPNALQEWKDRWEEQFPIHA